MLANETLKNKAILNVWVNVYTNVEKNSIWRIFYRKLALVSGRTKFFTENAFKVRRFYLLWSLLRTRMANYGFLLLSDVIYLNFSDFHIFCAKNESFI